MKQIDLRKIKWYKAGKLYLDSEYQYVIMFKGRLSTVMDDIAYRWPRKTEYTKDAQKDDSSASDE